MSETKPENPPAFPGIQTFEKFDDDRGKYVEYHLPADGMTLRDFFAAKALATVDREMWLAMCRDAPKSGRTPYEECAAHCGQLADALLTERTLTPANVYVDRSGHRKCRPCWGAYKKERRAAARGAQ